MSTEKKNYYPLLVSKSSKENPTLDSLICTDRIHAMTEMDLKDLSQQLVDAYNEKYAPKENSAHSFTEGSDVYGESDPSSAKVYIENKRIEFQNVDVVKVIEDLSKGAQWAITDLGELNEHNGQNVRIEDQINIVKSLIQNAEAALGMLQAFDKSGSIGTMLEKLYAVDQDSLPPLKDGRLQKIPVGYEIEMKAITHRLSTRLESSAAIGVVNAIDEMLKLRGL
jgi:hypothetical protein